MVGAFKHGIAWPSDSFTGVLAISASKKFDPNGSVEPRNTSCEP